MPRTLARERDRLVQTDDTLSSEPGTSMAPGSEAEDCGGPLRSRICERLRAAGRGQQRLVIVAEGEIFGILGPNGAGKTTTVECAVGLRSPDSGTIRLMGIDPQADKARIHEITGVQLQSGAFPAKLRVGEIIDMYRSFYRHPADVGEWPGRSASPISASPTTGPVRRPAAALVGRTGAHRRTQDRGPRRDDNRTLPRRPVGMPGNLSSTFWNRGTTVLLVTHFMEEAERLCDRVAFIELRAHRRARYSGRPGCEGHGRKDCPAPFCWLRSTRAC